MNSMNKLRSLFGLIRSKNRFRDLNNRKNLLNCGHNTIIDPEVIVDQPHSVKIGAHCVINHYTIFHGKGGIYLGDWTVIGPHCGFYAQNHSYEFNVNFLYTDFFEYLKDKKFDCFLFFSVLHWILKEKGINGVRDTLKILSSSSPVMFFDMGQDHEPKMRTQEWKHELIINKETIPELVISNSRYRYFSTGDTGRDVFKFTTSP